jgi:hypothetical protein
MSTLDAHDTATTHGKETLHMFVRPTRWLTASLLLLSAAAVAHAAPLGSAITYQGDLELNGTPVTGNYDFIFTLFSTSGTSAQVGTPQTVLNLPVASGLFTASIDFTAGVFDGSALWLEIRVRPAGTGSYTTLSPRQPITAAPYAVRALNNPPGSTQWTSDGPDLTYSAGGVGFLGTSSPFAAGKGVFIEGGNASYGSVYAFNYDTFSPVSLCLNPTVSAGVGVGLVAPTAMLDVYNKSGTGFGVKATTYGNLVFPVNAAVIGYGNTGTGIGGTHATGVWGQSTDAEGVFGSSTNSYGVSGASTNQDGVLGQSNGNGRTGVWGISYNPSGFGGVFQNNAGGVALYAVGLAKVKTLQILGGADLAERFDVEGDPEPGSVLRIDESRPGALRICDESYSARVAGVVSGANGLDAGIELGKGEARAGSVPVALSGRVWVKCETSSGEIHAGDLLTTSALAGHAMRAADRDRAQGAILGKAMTSLEKGTGLVLVLVSLQ